jgi:hypothetical protein
VKHHLVHAVSPRLLWLVRVRDGLVASIPRLPGYGQGNIGWRLEPRLNDLTAFGQEARVGGLAGDE